MIKHGEVNPLNVFGLRRLEHCPPHFEQVLFDSHVAEVSIANWIYENLEGRFYVGYRDVERDSSAFHRQVMVGFELAGEASFFSLLLPQINPAPVW